MGRIGRTISSTAIHPASGLPAAGVDGRELHGRALVLAGSRPVGRGLHGVPHVVVLGGAVDVVQLDAVQRGLGLSVDDLLPGLGRLVRLALAGNPAGAGGAAGQLLVAELADSRLALDVVTVALDRAGARAAACGHGETERRSEERRVGTEGMPR